MKRLNNLLFLVFFSVFLSACSTTEKVKKSGSLNPESFIAERQDKIDQMVKFGPRISVNKAKEQKIRNNERRQINKEERKNYISVSDTTESLFPVSFSFENVSIQDMAVMFSEVTGKNILVGDEVDGRISAQLNNVPWNKALDSVLKIKKLAKHVDEEANIIRIHKQDTLVAQEEFDRKRIEGLQKTRDAQRAVEPIYTEIVRLYYTSATEVKSEIESVMGVSKSAVAGASASSNTKVEITIDARLNSLIIKATKSELDLISRLIKEVDVRTKQVLIEAFIVEADDEYTKDLGAKFGIVTTDNLGNLDGNKFTVAAKGAGSTDGQVSDFGVVGGGAIGFILDATTAQLKIELSAAETDGVTKILSNPRVFTLDNEEAVVNQGVQIPYKVLKDGETTYQFKEAGVKLIVTPSIVGDGNIILKVKVEKKSEKTVAGADALAINVNEINTRLLIKDNTIVVIGGVYSQTTKDAVSKIPFFGDIPLLGQLFRKDTSADTRKELLIFLAPRII